MGEHFLDATKMVGVPKAGSQCPVDRSKQKNELERLFIVMHPAVRLGYLDARDGKPLDHDAILDRIAREAPLNALQELEWTLDSNNIGLAQYRYEEGRLIWAQCRCAVRGWSDPRFPPAAVRKLCETGVREAH